MNRTSRQRGWCATAIVALLVCCATSLLAQEQDPFVGAGTGAWIAATDSTRVRADDSWWVTGQRYAWMTHQATYDDGAVLEFDVELQGHGLILRLGSLPTPSYGGAHRGSLRAELDGMHMGDILPLDEDRELHLPLAGQSGSADGRHTLRLIHREIPSGAGARVEGLYVLHAATGSLTFHVGGEEEAHLVDVRARLKRGDTVVRDALVRNWQTGLCRLAGVPPGDDYVLEIDAIGWLPQRIDGIHIDAGQQTPLPQVFLERQPRTRAHGVRFPTVGHPVVRQAGDSLRTRLVVYNDKVDSIFLRRTVGPAVISRALAVREDTAAAYYYDQEYVATIPADMPPGLYDLIATVRTETDSWTVDAPRSVHIVGDMPADPVIMSFGHLDTWGQYQSEYLQRVAALADILGPDLVLNSNAVSAAHASGALVDLHVPYAITFGNHQIHGHEYWYGNPVGSIDFGDALAVLNFGHYWHDDPSQAYALLEQRRRTRLKVINAVEPNAPVASLLDEYNIAFIHDAHGPGDRVALMGNTPTQRAGKMNSESFRLIRFAQGRVVSATYGGDPQAPFPFGRSAPLPVRIEFDGPNDGTRTELTASVHNDFVDALPNSRVVFILRAGTVDVQGGRLESAIDSDDGACTVITVRCDLPASGTAKVAVRLP
jgi:hypothetical protein